MTANDGRFNSVTGSAAGKAGGRARRKLNPERVEHALGALTTFADAERWLQQLIVWGASRQVTGTALNGCVQGVRTWKDLQEAKASFEEIEKLRADVRSLREERDRAIRDLELARMGIR